jgi:O-succinylbenzoic acid--CoA ligase
VDALNVLAPMAAEERARPALIAPGFTWSFGDLARRAAALVRRFEARGIRAGARVAFVAAGSEEVFVAIHALAAMGATLVPLHPRLSAAEARVAIDVARPEHELRPEDLALPSDAELSAADVASSETGAAALPASSEIGAAISPDAPFAIVSTSGTTGRPKGAVLSRRAFLASAEASAQNLGWEPNDRWLLCMPLAHVGGLSIVTRCLIARRAVVLVPRFEPALVLDAIRRHHVTLLSVVPTMLHALIEADRSPLTSAPRDGETLRRPRAILLGGAAASHALLETCALLGIRPLTTYGLTEACSQVTAQSPRDRDVRSGCGRALPGFELRIMDDDGAPLATEPLGRIQVRGPAMFDGYLREDGRSVDPARTADGFFDTGDLGALGPRGDLSVYVRRSDLIVTGGENVYPAEVEQALERCPGVRRALVFGVPDERWGQIVAAAVELDPRAPIEPAALVDFVTPRLAVHKRPRKWAFVEQLPLTASGKVDRKDALSRHGALLRSVP